MENINSNAETTNKNIDEVKNGQNGNYQPTVDGIFSKSTKPNLPLAPDPDAEVYKRYSIRGTALIFNHKSFSMDYCSTRDGTEKDKDALEEVLEELKYDVRTYDDLMYEEIMEVLDVVSKMDHTNSECLLIAVMSHGEEGQIYAKDRTYQTKKLWTKFSPLHCPSLAGKPKLFFIQACRGNKTDPGIEVSRIDTDSVKSNSSYSIPVMADFLVMYATVEDYYAWRDPQKGSYFIQGLVRQLRQHHVSKDLLSILTCVNREVAIGFTSRDLNESEFHRKKQMCSIVSMLTRTYFLN